MISEEQKIRELRQEIDRLDKDIVDLLNERAAIALEIRNLKKKADIPVLDAQREDEILTKISLHNQGPLDEKSLKDIYKLILVRMKYFE